MLCRQNNWKQGDAKKTDAQNRSPQMLPTTNYQSSGGSEGRKAAKAKKRKSSYSPKYRGVNWIKGSSKWGKWVAAIVYDKQLCLGSSEDEEEAARAWTAAPPRRTARAEGRRSPPGETQLMLLGEFYQHAPLL
jgi:hypothetical protein